MVHSKTIRRFGEEALHYALLVFVIALPWSNFGLSVATISATIASLLLISSGIRPHQGFWIFVGLFLVFVPGILYTLDLQEGLKDLRIKAPLIALGLSFSMYIKQSHSGYYLPENLLRLFIYSCTSASFILIIRWLFFISEETLDSRLASPFISHIRLSQMLAIAAFAGIYKFSKAQQIVFAACSAFLLLSLIYFGWWSGIVSSMVMFLPWIIYTGFRKNAKTRNLFLFVISLLCIIFIYRNYTLYQPVKEAAQPTQMHTLNGRPYHFDYADWCIENGYRCGYYIQLEELRNQWNKRFSRNISQNDDRGSLLELTAIRYLTSLGLKKDSIGVYNLSLQDYENICKGIPNAQLSGKSPIEIRLYELRDEYRFAINGQSLGGHSISMRFIYFKTTLNLILKKPFWGYGTGSADKVYEEEYSRNNRDLKPQYRHRAHNQFLSAMLSGGVFAGIIFIVLIVFLLRNSFHCGWIPALSMLVVVFGMFAEDTLETQAGVALFCFAAGLYVWLPEEKASDPTHSL